MQRGKIIWANALGVGLLLSSLQWQAVAANYATSTRQPPSVAREFRGVWVASVGNIDWPSKSGLSVTEQKREFLAILDRAAQLRLNAIILQVRPASDALYASKLEPWSEYLTGEMGRAPEPFYDPLAFAVAEAHARGLELHAWFNPFRVRHASAKSNASSLHVSKKQPQLVKKYGKQLWFDPGAGDAQDHVSSVILDVVKRYDIDGVHLDDYFYPYKEKDDSGKTLDFPDDASWRRYQGSGGKLARDDWRRDNINKFVQRLYSSIKATKSWVKVGISPFGIWRPGNPPQIKGMDAYELLYADSRKWLASGWVDYLAPQLYWTIDPKEQSFPVLLKWWAEQNPKQRHVIAGISILGTSEPRSASEVAGQIQLSRSQPGVAGTIQWSVRGLMQNRQGIADKLQQGVFTQFALPPAATWLDSTPTARPTASASVDAVSGRVRVNWSVANGETPRRWLVQTQTKGKWSADILGEGTLACTFTTTPEVVAISGVDRCGNLSPPAVMERRSTAATGKR